METNVDIEICAPVTQMEKNTSGFTYRNTEPVPIMASTMVHGSFENIAGHTLDLQVGYKNITNTGWANTADKLSIVDPGMKKMLINT